MEAPAAPSAFPAAYSEMLMRASAGSLKPPADLNA
jgi:hypothetical protein